MRDEKCATFFSFQQNVFFLNKLRFSFGENQKVNVFRNDMLARVLVFKTQQTHLLGFEKNGFGCWVEKKSQKKIVRNQIADKKKTKKLMTLHFFSEKKKCRHVKFQKA